MKNFFQRLFCMCPEKFFGVCPKKSGAGGGENFNPKRNLAPPQNKICSAAPDPVNFSVDYNTIT
jgi:hypothetical protein